MRPFSPVGPLWPLFRPASTGRRSCWCPRSCLVPSPSMSSSLSAWPATSALCRWARRTCLSLQSVRMSLRVLELHDQYWIVSCPRQAAAQQKISKLFQSFLWLSSWGWRAGDKLNGFNSIHLHHLPCHWLWLFHPVKVWYNLHKGRHGVWSCLLAVDLDCC